MKYKKITNLFILNFLLIGCFIIAFNWIIDSTNFFNHDLLDTNYVNDSTVYKTEYLIDNYSNKEVSLVMGGSRPTVLKPELLKKITNKEWYNYAYNGGSPIEHYKNLKYLIRKKLIINEILLGLDYSSFTHETVPNRFPFQIHPLAKTDKQINTFNDELRFYADYLASYNITKSNIKALYKYLIGEPKGVIINVDNGTNNFLHQKRNIEILQDKWHEYFKSLDKKHPDFSKLNISNKQQQNFENFMLLCKKNKIKVRLFFNPTSYITLKHQSLETQEKIYEYLTKDLSLEFDDFAFFNILTMSPDNFYDDSHYRSSVGDEVINSIYSVCSNSGICKKVTKNNLSNHIKFIKYKKEINN
jgi:hypothetical protein